MFSDKMSLIVIFFKLVRFVNKISTRLLPFAIGVSDDVTEAVYEGLLVKNLVGFLYIFLYSRIKKGLCVANITAIRILISGSALNEKAD